MSILVKRVTLKARIIFNNFNISSTNLYCKKSDKNDEKKEKKKNISATGTVEGTGGVGTINEGGVLSGRQTAIESEYFHRKSREDIEKIRKKLAKEEDDEEKKK